MNYLDIYKTIFNKILVLFIKQQKGHFFMIKLRLAENSEDIEFLYKTRINPEIDKMLSGNPPSSFEEHEKFFENNQKKLRWIYIAENTEKERIGYSQIYDVKEDQLEVGFAISPDYQGKGYGKNLVMATIEKAKETFPDRKIVLYVKTDNPKAIYIYKKYGFKEIEEKNNLTYMEII